MRRLALRFAGVPGDAGEAGRRKRMAIPMTAIVTMQAGMV